MAIAKELLPVRTAQCRILSFRNGPIRRARILSVRSSPLDARNPVHHESESNAKNRNGDPNPKQDQSDKNNSPINFVMINFYGFLCPLLGEPHVQVEGRFYPERVQLEPPFRPFEGHVLPQNFFQDDGREASLFSSMAGRLLGFLADSPVAEATAAVEEVEPNYSEDVEEIAEIQFSLPRDSQPSPEVFEQCVFSLAYCRAPISFEVIGTQDALVVQVACSIADSTTIFAQLKSHFPDAVLTPVQNFLSEKFQSNGKRACRIHELGLEREFMLPLKPRKDWQSTRWSPCVAHLNIFTRMNSRSSKFFFNRFEIDGLRTPGVR
jgi:hypothetical protein